MIQSFDYFNRYEIPPMTLCQPNKEELFALGELSDRKLSLRFNGLSEFSFTAKSKTLNTLGETVDTPYFSYLDYRRLVYIQNIGYFMIVDFPEDSDGFSDTKKVVCKSLEVELNTKRVSLFKGTFPLYDLFEPQRSLLGTLLQYAPDWTIAEVDTELTTVYRTFDETDTSIYNLLMNKVSQTYNCLFSFDTINKTISVHTVDNATTPTDIYLSYDNLLENTNLKPITSELCTALNVLGSEPLSIRTVNPLGTDTIYDFSYYKNTDWMSGSLVTAVTNWENAVLAAQPTYATLLAELKNQNTILITQQSELADLEGELTELETLRTVKIRQGLDLSVITPQINAKNTEISAKKEEILVTQRIISHAKIEDEYGSGYGLQEQLANINASVSFAYNFTAVQFAELSHFIIGSTYTNTNFVQTDSMSGSAIQQQSQELYDQAVGVLAKISEPRYTFEINSVNFVFLKEFQTFITQLVLGAIITINIKDNVFTYPAILGFDIDYDNPEQFKLLLSNRLRLDDEAFQFSDLFSQPISSGLTTQFNSEIWKNFQDNYRNDVSDFIKNALDASAKSIVDAKNQSFIIDGNGIRGRYLPDPNTDVFDPEQLGIINNLIVFTDDNWASAKTALGKVTTPAGVPSFGLVAEVVVGNLIAGNNLYISNDDNTFTVDGRGATLTNAKFTLFGNSNKNKILLDPNAGIEISKKNSGGTYDRTFYVDTEGNLVFTGNLQGATGTFTGTIFANIGKIGAWTIDEYGLSDIYGNYIYGNGSIRLGALRIDRSEAWFDGNIYANNLNGLVMSHQIGSVNASTINTGTLRAIDIYGCRIAWPGVLMHSILPGVALIETDESVSLASGENRFTVNRESTIAKAKAGGAITLNAFEGVINLVGPIQTLDIDGNVGWAKTTNVIVDGQLLSFVNGLLVDPSHYTSSGSYTSGSGVTPPTPSGSATFLQTESWDILFGRQINPASATYAGNGILQITPMDFQYDTTISWVFRVQYSGPTSQVGEIRVDWEHLSGTCEYTLPTEPGFRIYTGKYVGSFGGYTEWFNVAPRTDLSPSLLCWMTSTYGSGGVIPLLTSGTMYDNLNAVGGRVLPDLGATEDRWFIIQIETNDVLTTCQWKIKKLYVRPPGTTGEADITVWENP